MALIYLSSTFNDLKDYREAVYRTLREMRHDVIAMEDYVATDSRPLDKCLADVARCDLYVGIFAFAYGYIPEQGNPDQKSITELEYRKAGEVGLQRLVFMVKEGTPWPTTLIDALAGEKGARIAAFRTELQRQHTDSFFESKDELARKVSVAVQQELARPTPARFQIDWQGPYQRLVTHMRAFAGARSEQEALKRNFPLRLQATPHQLHHRDLPVGSWDQLVSYPGRFLLTGDPGSGKTTLLLGECYRLSVAARECADVPIPIYLSLKTFAGGDANTLLEMAAEVNKVETSTLKALWSEPRRAICLVLDGGDETAHREALIDAIIELACALDRPVPSAAGIAASELRSLVVACHPGPLQQRVARRSTSWRELLFMPLRDVDLDAMLDLFDAGKLAPKLDERLRRKICRPDLLSALAQSARDRPTDLLPRNAAEIYDLYLRHVFTAQRSAYDYDRVLRPILACLAFWMVRRQQTGLPCDDALYDALAVKLEEIDRRYSRRRRIMPADWTAQDVHDELLRSPVVDLAAGRGEALTFSKAVYRDFFVAIYLNMMGMASDDTRRLVSDMNEPAELQPLAFLLDMTADAVTLLDAVPPKLMLGSAEIWLETKAPGAPAPNCLRDAFERGLAALKDERLDLAGTGAAPARSTRGVVDVRARLKEVQSLVMQRPNPASLLLEAAMDDHPLVRMAAEYALIHAGDPCAYLNVDVSNGGFRWRSYGGGDARIGPLRLLRVPVPAVLELDVAIESLDIDPFQEEVEFSFLPMPPAIFAANLFATKAVDWLELLARFQAIAHDSDVIARHAASRNGLERLACQLSHRALSFANVGCVLARDLGLPWTIDLPGDDGEDPGTDVIDYTAVRRLFDSANRARSLRLVHLAEDFALEVKIRFEVEVGDSATGVRIASLDESHRDADDPARFKFFNLPKDAGTVKGATICAFEVIRAGPFPRTLPLSVHINERVHAENVIDGAELAVVIVRRLEGKALPWRVVASVRIERFANSRFVGISFDSG